MAARLRTTVVIINPIGMGETSLIEPGKEYVLLLGMESYVLITGGHSVLPVSSEGVRTGIFQNAASFTPIETFYQIVESVLQAD